MSTFLSISPPRDINNTLLLYILILTPITCGPRCMFFLRISKRNNFGGMLDRCWAHLRVFVVPSRQHKTRYSNRVSLKITLVTCPLHASLPVLLPSPSTNSPPAVGPFCFFCPLAFSDHKPPYGRKNKIPLSIFVFIPVTCPP